MKLFFILIKWILLLKNPHISFQIFFGISKTYRMFSNKHYFHLLNDKSKYNLLDTFYHDYRTAQ
jgi:hypothetical protein